jgi:hypothetical protein
LLPLLAAAGWLVFPGLGALPPVTEARRLDLIRPVLLSVGAAADFAGLTDLTVWSVPLVVVGIGMAGPALRGLVAGGSAVAGAGLSGALAAGLLGLPLVVPYVSWTIAGLGIGLAYPTIYLVTMERAGGGAAGSAVALMLLVDSLGVSVGTGLGGSAVALADASGAGLSTGLTATFVLAVAAALGLAALAPRLERRSRAP